MTIRARSFSRSRTLLTATVAALLAAAVGGGPAQAAGEVIPEWQKYEPASYDTTTTPRPGQVRVATPQDTALHHLNGDVVFSWWLLKDPKDPAHSLILLEAEVGWQSPRQIGQRGNFVWTLLDEENANSPQFPFLNGILSFRHGVPLGGITDSTQIDGKPGIRGRTLSINHAPEANTWSVQARSPLASANFTVDHVVPGIYGTFDGPTDRTIPINIDPVLNSRVTGSAMLNGRSFNLDGWRAEYWRQNMFPSIADSQLNPATSWRGWEYAVIMEPDGGGSQFLGIITPDGKYTGALVDARPSGTRICARTTVEFGDYRYGRSMFGDISPPFQRYTIPGWIKVKCGPGEPVQMEKTFYPDRRDYLDIGLTTGTEMPVHTVPGSFGTYEHWRYSTYRMQKFLEGTRS